MNSPPAPPDRSNFDAAEEAKLARKLEPLVKPGKLGEVAQIFEMTVSRYHSGPLPSPDTLAGYEAAHPGLAERIVVMAEGEQSHRHKQESRMVIGEYAIRLAGQAGAILTIVLLAMLVGFCAYVGQPLTAGVVAAIGGAAGYFLHRQRPSSKASDAKQPPRRKRK